MSVPGFSASGLGRCRPLAEYLRSLRVKRWRFAVAQQESGTRGESARVLAPLLSRAQVRHDGAQVEGSLFEDRPQLFQLRRQLLRSPERQELLAHLGFEQGRPQKLERRIVDAVRQGSMVQLHDYTPILAVCWTAVGAMPWVIA